MDKNNRSKEWTERPRRMAIGNNKNTRNLRRIVKYLDEGPKTFGEIATYLNTNWTHGVTPAQLGNIMSKGPFVRVGTERGAGIYANAND